MDRYLFLHIRKTAGRSIRRALCSVLGPDAVSPPIGSHFDEVDIDQISQYRVVVGHFSYAEVPRFPNRRVFTFLRDPVDVIISKYFFRRNLSDIADPMVRLARELPLAEFLRQGEQIKGFFNEAAWQLAGVGPAAFVMPENEILALALDRLLSLDFVGLYEELPDSLDLMSYMFGWPAVESIPHDNITKGRLKVEELDSWTVQRILQLNRLDAELYWAGRELFLKRKRLAWKAAITEKLATGDRRTPQLAPATTPKQANSGPRPAVGRVSTGEARVLKVDVAGRVSSSAKLRSGEHCVIRATILPEVCIREASVVLRIFNEYGQLVYSALTSRLGEYLALEATLPYDIVFHLTARIVPGAYRVAIELCSGRIGMHQLIEYVENAGHFEISGYAGPPFRGVADLQAEITTGAAPGFGNEYRVGEAVDFTTAGNAPLYTLRGWSDPEPWARWTDGNEADLFLRLNEIPRCNLELQAEVHPFCVAGLPGPEIDAIANGHPVATWAFNGEARFQPVRALLPAAAFHHPGLHLVFHVRNARIPAAHADTPDTRALGLAFRTLAVHPYASGSRSLLKNTPKHDTPGMF